MEKIVEKVFHKKNEFSTEKLTINFINDYDGDVVEFAGEKVVVRAKH